IGMASRGRSRTSRSPIRPLTAELTKRPRRSASSLGPMPVSATLSSPFAASRKPRPRPPYTAPAIPRCMRSDSVAVSRERPLSDWTRSRQASWVSRTVRTTSSSATCESSESASRTPGPPDAPGESAAACMARPYESVNVCSLNDTLTRPKVSGGSASACRGSCLVGGRLAGLVGGTLCGLALGLGLTDGAVGPQARQLDHVARGVLDGGGLDHHREGLAAQDLLHQLGDVVVLEHVVRELLRILAGLLGPAHQVLGQLALVDP